MRQPRAAQAGSLEVGESEGMGRVSIGLGGWGPWKRIGIEPPAGFSNRPHSEAGRAKEVGFSLACGYKTRAPQLMLRPAEPQNQNAPAAQQQMRRKEMMLEKR